MKCEQAEMLMAELLAGEIKPPDREALEKHLLDCATCRADFELARAGAAVEWPPERAPRALVDRTLAALRRPPAAVRVLRYLTGAAAALAVALLVVGTARRPALPPGAPPAPRAPVLAMMQEPVVGTLVAKDEDGRPVGELGLKSHHVTVEILDGIAKTTVEENFQNHTDRRLEGTFHFPLPPDASISRLALEVNGKIEEGTCLERERAREVFESIVRKMQDPALLEWMPGGIFKCRVFPIEPRSTKRVIVAYTQALPFFRGKMAYVYPLASEKTKTHPPEEVRIDVRARFSGRLERIESPSHRLDVQRRDEREAAMSFRATNYRAEKDFVLALETSDEELRVVPHKADGDDGYFALFLTPRGAPERKPGRYAFVLDVSASVSAPELEVAKKLVRAMVERGIAGDRFEILAQSVDVERSGAVDLRGANDFMDRLRPVGACDVLAALRAAPEDAEVVYIGEGTPTLGETDASKILEAVKGRRIRTIAVGSDANLGLLEKLGGHFRISTNDDVNKRVAEIAATLGSPVLSGIRVDGGDAVYEVVGVRDIFYGERLAVTGRYRGQAAKLVVTGRDYRRELEVALPLKEEANNYVRRLWAQRKVADLLAEGGKKDEVTALGVKHQIMTPYTSFLVLETEQMWKDYQLRREVQKQDQVLGKAEKTPAVEPTLQDKTNRLLEDGTRLYKEGRLADAYSKFEDAFLLKPSSDVVYNYIKRAGEDVVAGMMNSPDRHVQDTGRRLFELAKPGEPLREGKATVEAHLQDLKADDFAVWRNSYWHLKNFGPHAVRHLLPALGDGENDRYRTRAMMILSDLGTDTSLAVAEALNSRNPVMRQNAAVVLGNIRDERSLPALKRVVEDPNERPEVKKLAAEAVRKITRTEEDPRTKAIREAYEEQLRRETQLATIAPRNAAPERPAAPAPVAPRAADPTPAPAPAPVEPAPRVPALNPGLPLVGGAPAAQPTPAPPVPEAVKPPPPPHQSPKRPIPVLPETVALPPGVIEPLPPREAAERIRQAEGSTGRLIVDGGAKTREEVTRRDVSPPPIHNVVTNVAAQASPREKYDRDVALLRDYLASLRPVEPQVSTAAVELNAPGFNTQESARLESYDFLGHTFHLGESGLAEARQRWHFAADYDDFLHDVGVELISPAARGGGPLTGATFDRGIMHRGIDRYVFTLDEGDKRTGMQDFPGVDISLGRGLEKARSGFSKLDGDQDALVRQLEVQQAQIQELNRVVEAQKEKLARSLNEKSNAAGELARLSQDLAQIEEKHIEVARDKKMLEERINAINQMGIKTDVAPRKPIEGKTTAVANEIGLTVFSVGKDDGVLEGDEFTVYRGGDFVAKVVVDRADRKWSAGRVVLKKSDPRPGDDISNHIFVSAARTGEKPAGPPGDVVKKLIEERKAGKSPVTATVLSASETPNVVLLNGGQAAGLARGQVFAISRDSKFVALVLITEVSGSRAAGGVWRGMSVGRVLPGDKAERVTDLRTTLAGLPEDVRLEMASKRGLQGVRAKMGW